MLPQTLLIDPSLMPAFRPVAAAVLGVRVNRNIKVTVLDRMNLFRVHDQAVHLIAIRKNRSE
jgi:hypothetical protein